MMETIAFMFIDACCQLEYVLSDSCKPIHIHAVNLGQVGINFSIIMCIETCYVLVIIMDFLCLWPKG